MNSNRDPTIKCIKKENHLYGTAKKKLLYWNVSIKNLQQIIKKNKLKVHELYKEGCEEFSLRIMIRKIVIFK